MDEYIYLLDTVMNIDVLQYCLSILYALIVLAYLLYDQYYVDFLILFLKNNLVFQFQIFISRGWFFKWYFSRMFFQTVCELLYR